MNATKPQDRITPDVMIVPHIGNIRPVAPDTVVRVDLGDGTTGGYVGRADEFDWGPGLGPDGEGRIVGWVPLVPTVPAPSFVARRRRPTLLLARFTSARRPTFPVFA